MSASRPSSPRSAAKPPPTLAGSGLGGEALALMPDAEAAVAVLPHLHAATGQGAGAPRQQPLQPMLAEAHGVVAAHDAGVAKAADLPGIAAGSQRPPRERGDGGRHGEAGIETGQKGGQDRVGLLPHRRPSEPQFRDQPVLERVEEELDAPFGLRRLSRDRGDGQVAQGAPHLGRLPVPGQLLFQRLALPGRRHEDGVPSW